MGSRRRLNRNARAQHEFLLTNEDSARRKRDARKRRKAVKREDISLANALVRSFPLFLSLPPSLPPCEFPVLHSFSHTHRNSIQPNSMT